MPCAYLEAGILPGPAPPPPRPAGRLRGGAGPGMPHLCGSPAPTPCAPTAGPPSPYLIPCSQIPERIENFPFPPTLRPARLRSWTWRQSRWRSCGRWRRTPRWTNTPCCARRARRARCACCAVHAVLCMLRSAHCAPCAVRKALRSACCAPHAALRALSLSRPAKPGALGCGGPCSRGLPLQRHASVGQQTSTHLLSTTLPFPSAFSCPAGKNYVSLCCAPYSNLQKLDAA